MSSPDIKYFASSGTWAKPAGAVRVDIVLRGGQAAAIAGAVLPTTGPPGGLTAARLGTRLSPNGYVVSNGEPGEIRVSSFDAADLPDAVEVEVGKGGRPGGRDGYALVVTHLAGDEKPAAELEFIQSSINLNTEHLEHGEGGQR